MLATPIAVHRNKSSISPPHSTCAPTPEIDQDIIDQLKLGNAECSLISFPMNAAFNCAVVCVQGVLMELSEEVRMKYEKVETDSIRKFVF